MTMKYSWRTWSCIWALSVGSSACGVSDSELPGSGAYNNNDPELTGEGGQPALDAGESGSLPVAGNGSISLGVAGSGTKAGSGGSASGGAAGKLSGAGGAGGSSQPVAGSGAAGMIAAAGSGGSAGEPAVEDPCPSDYVMATHIVINVSWEGTLALAKGSGQVHVWTKSSFHEDGSTATIESQSCGSVLPPITTGALAGSEKILPEIPDTAWDAANMPKFTGTCTRNGDVVTVDPGVALVGLSMSDPTAAWPAAKNISGVDHDGDGKSGLTAIPKETDGFKAIPTDISRSKRADKVYLAIRNMMTLTATAPECSESYSGTANVSKFENHVIGCHVKGGNECDDTQKKFVDDNRTVYVLGKATFSSMRVPATATCADVRAALPR